MAQKLTLTQEQKLAQIQRLSQQQMLQVRMLEMPLTELEQNIQAEIDDNPAIETTRDDLYDVQTTEDDYDTSPISDSEQAREQEERNDVLDDVLSQIGNDDSIPTSYREKSTANAEYEERVYGDTTSFYDKLKEQMGETDLTERQTQIMEYLIGSLDDDGLLRKKMDDISDELAIYHNLDASEKEIIEVLDILRTFDPAGIGACSLQECLLLQVARKTDSRKKGLMLEILQNHFESFIKKHTQKIQRSLKVSENEFNEVINEIKRLNPKPGASLGETQGYNVQQITPDFIVETDDRGYVSCQLNRGNIPTLHVSPEFKEMADTYQKNKQSMSRQQKEALLYAKEKVDRAKGFIEAIRQRRQTMLMVMNTIIRIQKPFFKDGDEAEIRPMILKDIAEMTNLDISTVSRVCSIKYAQTKWGLFPLRFFFSEGTTSEDGEELSTRKIKIKIKEIIDKEDKNKPLSDDKIKSLMEEKGFVIARRTIAKYREQMGIPVARLRK